MRKLSYVLLLLLILASPAWGAWAFVKTAGFAGVTNVTTANPSVSVSFGTLPSQNNAIVVGLWWFTCDNAATYSLGDNQTNTYTQDVLSFAGGAVGEGAAIFSSLRIGAPSGTFTVTFTSTHPGCVGDYLSIVATEYSYPGSTTALLDQTQSQQNLASGTSIDTGATATTSSALELLAATGQMEFTVGQTLTQNAAGSNPASGWTSRGSTLSALFENGDYVDNIVSTTLTAEHVWTLGTATTNRIGVVATYKEPSAAARERTKLGVGQ